MKASAKLEGASQAIGTLQGFSARRLGAALATALTRTATAMRPSWQQELQQRLDRPTPGTLAGVRTNRATAARLQAELYLRDQSAKPGAMTPAEWLSPQEQGGGRRVKKFERALMAQGAMPTGAKVVPGKHARLDGYGNVSRGQITQVLNQLGADLSPGYARTISKSATKRLESARRSGRLYVAFPRAVGRIKPGIYQRGGPGGRRLLPVFWFVSAVGYQKRVDLLGAASREAPQVLTREALRALDEHRARILAKGVAQA